MSLDVTIGGASAEAYISATDASTYHSDRGNTAWASASTAEQEAALRRGAEYLDAVYLLRWKGAKATSGQAMQWPRIDVVDSSDYSISSSILPVPLKRANAELALRALSEDLFPDLARGGEIQRVKAGEVEVEFSSTATPYKVYREVEELLGDLLRAPGRMRLGG